ncbi:hypothetical protein OJF2_21920 [Aquisphaera giovannonii]|uniref:Uncharacterized protein n=1 Tax=Aquisphaera giovannonii TaxID=406548 RepID=A0A5B9VZ50_9BACT|nr:hypothetical protein [Aquisphaera giovannonii]QEH33686.1 hypothetical protein OJF2_21920 [Aquisphaera giovannonii]
MSDDASRPSESPSSPRMARDGVDLFEALDTTIQTGGPEAAIAKLIDDLDSAGDYRALLDALLLKARHDLGLPLLPWNSLSGLAEPGRGRFEERYVEAIRLVASRYLEAGEIPSAWSYFRAIGEPEPVAAALDRYAGTDDAEMLGRVIDVAFQQGANPRRGFELILEHYGTCSAITALEQAPPADPAIQVGCIGALIRHLHRELHSNVRADMARRGWTVTESPTIAGLIAGRDELFADEAYHVDVSHLSATVRYSILVTDRDALSLALDLAEYGRRLSPRLQFEGSPPFERTFEDHLDYLKALAGDDPEPALSRLRRRLESPAEDDFEATVPAQVLVNLLTRIGRHEEALELLAERLGHLPDQMLSCPGLTELALRSGRMDRLAVHSRRLGQAVSYLASRLQPARSANEERPTAAGKRTD